MEFEIILRDLRFYAFHGVMEEERHIGNEYIVNLSVWIPYTDFMEDDDVNYTVSYADLFQIIKVEMEIPRNLLEKFCISVARRIRTSFPGVMKGRVSIKKVRPPIPSMLGEAEVALEF